MLLRVTEGMFLNERFYSYIMESTTYIGWEDDARVLLD
jgi:hypothetical protein